ncbi:cell wall metabolism sensor histidine kinase WalK [Aerococcaceae bacterium zg-ZUI334]|uniref:cell wall metabolism sensor histidine kinase WalK n=1 Tax=Aerococcaceae TaxID=186827 RepID=UPI0013BA7E01|nr:MULTISPECIES: cell wall metabolism sensor histidine kinase WalK [unclassified Facklamia]MBR7927732.1 cell wall metabolism sensor histidine kinase WalK [Aerococcaceae bacterium zg-ZUI334]NEW64534.1 cell wall metabolism sensor histidine kinase WalK [Facklamia sp. 252]NEW67741.1 cell wall metabolism sensor histidine kinase WalK [Facklamia sp. 253]QQD65717.1 cell wall metabolism sensor histidine kinase WalK [Aerococcaceae bacterium zg-252]
MKRQFSFIQSIHIKIPMLFIFILLIAFQFIGVFFIDQLQSQAVTTFKETWNTQSSFLINNVRPLLEPTDNNSQSASNIESQLSQILATFTTEEATRIYILNTQGYVLATNQSGLINTIGQRTENENALSVATTRQAYAQELHDYVRNNRMYILIRPIMSQDNSQFLGIVSIEASMNPIYNQTNSVMLVFLQSAVIAIIVAFVIALLLSQALTHPIAEIRRQAMRISDGVYNYPASVYGQDELGDLAFTVNELAVKVKESQESIEAERQRLDGILRHMTDGVIGTDRRGNVLLVNERAVELLNLKQQDALGISILSLLGIKESYSVKDLLVGDNEVLINRPDGTILKGEIAIIRRDTGFVTGLVCVLTDITEQEKTEQERREFVSNVSHELRTPLTSVKSYSEALIDGAWKDNQIAPQFLDVIQSETNRMIRMIGNLLDLSKIDGGQIKPQMELIDFKRIVAHILDRFVFTLENGESEKKYTIHRDFTNREIYLEIDQDRMTQVIDNIMNNAIKYSPDGGEIFVKIEETENVVILSIQDEGLGIPQKDIPHLFERFYRVDKARSRDQGGTGLGLAISKEVVELHGGRIWVESEENKGSTFFVELPYANFDLDLDDDEGWD